MEDQQFRFPELLRFEPDQGEVLFFGSRKLIFQADALGELRKELLNSLGEEIARGVLTRFGYQCGYKDAEALKSVFADRQGWILAGPLLHSWQGVVRAQNEELQFDDCGRLVVMRGSWSHSYEAEQHLRIYGPAREPVCWTLVGYASGYATSVLGYEVLCLETACTARGDSSCIYEIRPAEAWGAEARRQMAYFQPCTAGKSLGQFLLEEKEQQARRRELLDALLAVSSAWDEEKLAQKMAFFARKLTGAGGAVMMVLDAERGKTLIKTAGNKATWSAADYREWVRDLIECGEVMREGDRLGVPLVARGRTLGALAVVAKPGSAFSRDEEESLRILVAEAAVVLENIWLTEQLRTQLAVTENLELEKELLDRNHQMLQSVVMAQGEVARVALDGQGLPGMVQALAQKTGAAVAFLDPEGKLLAGCGDVDGSTVLVQAGGRWRAGGGREAAMGETASGVSNHRPGEEQAPTSALRLPLLVGGRQLGYLVLQGKERPLGAGDRLLAEQVLPFLAMELLQDTELEFQNRARFVQRLLTDQFERPDVLVPYAARVGMNLAADYRVLVVQVENTAPSIPALEPPCSPAGVLQVLEAILQRRGPGNLAVYMDGLVVILAALPQGRQQQVYARELVAELRGGLAKRFPHMASRIAVGRECHELPAFRSSFAEARAALRLMERLRQRDGILFCDQLGIFNILLDVQEAKLIEFTRHTLGRLLDYDRRTNGTLLATLRALARNNYNLHQTAKSEYIGLSTLKYRLKRIQEVGGLDLKQPEVRLQVELALKLLEQFC